jgi:hypothetical protein
LVPFSLSGSNIPQVLIVAAVISNSRFCLIKFQAFFLTMKY